MCARFSLTAPPELLARFFGFLGVPEWEPRFNVAPTQAVPVLRGPPPALVPMRFGLLPPWTKDPKGGPPLINARADTIFDKPAFRGAARRRRCVVPATGFYEWRSGPRGKEALLFRLPDAGLFGFAGIWEAWRPLGGEAPPVESFAIVTTEANALVGEVHDRMPVLLRPDDFARWLGPLDDGAIAALLRPAPDDLLVAVPVGPHVNSVRNEGPDCWAPRSA